MWPFNTVTDPYGRSNASAAAESAVPHPHGRRAVRDAGEIALQPLELLVTERRKRLRLEVEHVAKADEANAVLLEAVPRPILAVVIELLEIAAEARIERIVFARHRMHTIDFELSQKILRLAEFLGLGKMAHIARVHDELGRFG